MCLTAIFGCGREFPIAPARGVVRIAGQPATAGHVLFLPVGGGQKAIGKIQPDGSFVLTSYREGDGAQVGQHRVAIVRGTTAQTNRATSYRCNKDFRAEVVADQENEFTLDVDPRHGWQAIDE